MTEAREVVVPRHVADATVRTLLFLSDVCGLISARPQIQEARNLVRIFKNLLERGWPHGAVFVEQIEITKTRMRNHSKRLEEYDKAVAKLRSVFVEHDQKHQSACRFYVTLSKVAD